MDAVTVKLDRPFEHNGTRYETIVVDDPSGAAIVAMERAIKDGLTDTEAMFKLLATDLGIPTEALQKMRSSDIKKVTAALTPFVTPEETTGAT